MDLCRSRARNGCEHGGSERDNNEGRGMRKKGREKTREGKTMKDRNGERVAGESVKVNDPRATRSWPTWAETNGKIYTGGRTWMDRRRYYRRQYHLAHRALCESTLSAWAPLVSLP